MEKLYQYLPEELVTFILVTVFSLLIGLSLRRISLKREGETTLFGTDRTFTFIGILGYLLYILDPTDYRLFMGGGAVLGLLLALNYYVKQAQFHVFGVTTIVIALITYCIAPIVATQPSWFYVMVIVTVLLFTELKHTFTELAQRMKNDEMITLAKFLAISGIILPMLPDDNLIPGINLTPYSIWLATVVVSGISYLSYLLKRYVFRESGILVSGIVGGLYSSTATISVLARKSRKVSAQEAPEYVAAMLLAVSMMFLRFLILIGIFSVGALTAIYPYLLIMSAVAAGTAWFLHSRWKRPAMSETVDEDEDGSNPLEFKVALIFAVLFVVFTIATHYTLIYAGEGGLTLLSFVSGFSDITPFILNLLQGTGNVPVSLITACSMQAIVSNIAVNMCYALFFSGKKSPLRSWVLRGFGCVIAADVPFVNAIAIALVVFPLSVIYSTVRPCKRTVSVLHTVLEVSYIFIAAGMIVNTFTGTFTLHIRTFVTVARMKEVNALAMLHILFPITHILITIGIFKRTFAITHIILPLTVVFATVIPD